MATYQELHIMRGLPSTDPLRQRIGVATAIKANALAKAAPTPAQKAWALAALANPSQDADRLLNYILAEYAAQSTGVIAGASDAQVQSAVNAAVDTLLGA